MNLIEKDTMDQILSHYHRRYHGLLKDQIVTAQKIIQDNISEYTSDKGFQKALDLLLKKTIEGAFLPKEN